MHPDSEDEMDISLGTHENEENGRRYSITQPKSMSLGLKVKISDLNLGRGKSFRQEQIEKIRVSSPTLKAEGPQANDSSPLFKKNSSKVSRA
jgi:hypothetical protein